MGRGAWIVFASIFFASTEAHAFCRTTTCDPHKEECHENADGCIKDGAPLTWTQLPIIYRFSTERSAKVDTDLARKAIERAFDRWSHVQCGDERTSLRFQKGSYAGPGQDFGIYFRDDEWPHDDADETLALTNVNFGQTFGDIQHVDMEINTAQYEFEVGNGSGTVDLEAVITHEVGHYIGLAHSNVAESIMAPRYCQSGDRCGGDAEKARELSLDDMDAVCTLYPPQGISGVHYAEPTAGGCSTAPGPAGALPFAGVAALSAVILRRRRTR